MAFRDGERASGGNQPYRWVAIYLGLLAIAFVWAWGVAWLSGCALPWDCRSSGQFDPGRIAAVQDMLSGVVGGAPGSR